MVVGFLCVFSIVEADLMPVRLVQSHGVQTYNISGTPNKVLAVVE